MIVQIFTLLACLFFAFAGIFNIVDSNINLGIAQMFVAVANYLLM